MKYPQRSHCSAVGVLAAALLASATLFAASRAAAADDIARDALTVAEKRAATVADRFQRTWARYAIAQAWSRTDPAHAADLADRLESWTAKRDQLSELMFAWAQTDPQAAARWGVDFKKRTKGTLPQRNTALHYAVVGMVAKNRELANELIWKHLEEEGWGGKPRTAPLAVSIELAKTDPAAALAMAEKIGHDEFRINALRGVLREWACKDPAAARAALDGRKEVEFRKTFSRDLTEGWAKKDPKAAAAYAKTIEDRPSKVMALALVAREMAKTDLKAAAELCSTFAALDVSPWHEQRGRQGKILAEIGHAYALQDQKPAVAWAESIPVAEGGGGANAIDGVAAGWAEKDPAAALDYYAGAMSGEASGEAAKKPRGSGAAYPAIARQLTKRDAMKALKLVTATKSLVLQSHIVHEVAVELAKTDPAAAAEVVETWAGVADYYTYRAGAAAVVAEAWACKDPKRAAAWSKKLFHERDRSAALRAVGHGWATRDSTEALAWAQSIQNPQEAVQALVGVAEATPIKSETP